LGRRRRYLPWVVCATLAAAGVPALALGQADPPSSASVVVSDTGFAPGTVDILVGGKVNFSYPSGNGVYNVVWDRGSLEPATCEQTQGVVWGYGTTLPWWMQAAPWAGNCTFTKAGTYTYHSGVDPDKMKGTVVVHADATPTATPTVTATPTATATPTTTATPTATPTTPAATPTPAPPVPTVTPAPPVKPSVKLAKPSKTTVAKFAKSGLKLRATCTGAMNGTATVTVSSKDRKALKLKSATLAKATVKCKAGVTSITLKPTKATIHVRQVHVRVGIIRIRRSRPAPEINRFIRSTLLGERDTEVVHRVDRVRRQIQRAGEQREEAEPKLSNVPVSAAQPASPTNRYNMFNACYGLQSARTGRWLTDTNVPTFAAATEAAGTPLYFKPTALGRYMLYSPERRYLSGGQPTAGYAAAPFAWWPMRQRQKMRLP